MHFIELLLTMTNKASAQERDRISGAIEAVCQRNEPRTNPNSHDQNDNRVDVLNPASMSEAPPMSYHNCSQMRPQPPDNLTHALTNDVQMVDVNNKCHHLIDRVQTSQPHISLHLASTLLSTRNDTVPGEHFHRLMTGLHVGGGRYDPDHPHPSTNTKNHLQIQNIQKHLKIIKP